MAQKKVLKHMQKRKQAVMMMMMMMMIPQKNVQSSPKKRLKHICKKKNCGDDDDGTECSFLQISYGTGHQKFSPNFFCAIIINRVFFLYL
jgi:hypothetical protein